MKQNIIPEITPDVVNRFYNHVAVAENKDLCWEWQGAIRGKDKPYGRFGFKGKLFSAHRVSYKISKGADPMEMHVLHTCDNCRCVNPKHLFLGTNADNVADKVSKGRQAKNTGWKNGVENHHIAFWKNHFSKASENDYEEMRKKYEQGLGTLQGLSSQYGSSKKSLAKYIRLKGSFVPSQYTVLTAQQVLDIREKYIPNVYSSKVLGREYGVGGKTILDIVHRNTWKTV